MVSVPDYGSCLRRITLVRGPIWGIHSLTLIISWLGPIRYNGDFVIAGFVSTYFTVILPGFQMLLVITGSSLCSL